jgi:hypothetical protein
MHKKPDISFPTYRNEGKTHIEEVEVLNIDCKTYMGKECKTNLRNKENFKISQHFIHFRDVRNIGPSASNLISKLQGRCKTFKLFKNIYILLACSNAEIFI